MNTNPFTTNECFILTNHISSHTKAFGYKLTLITSLKENFLSFGLAKWLVYPSLFRATSNSLLSANL